MLPLPQSPLLPAGAAEKNEKQQDDDPPHIVAVKEIAQTAHSTLPQLPHTRKHPFSEKSGLSALPDGVRREAVSASSTILCAGPILDTKK